jgi:ferredoxin
MATLTFKDRSVPATKGHDVLGQLLTVGADVQYLCMSGSCGTCTVKIVSGAEHLAPPTEAETHCLKTPGTRLACQACTTGTGDVTVDQ